MPQHIFHLITSLRFGGTERFLKQITLGLRERYDFSIGILKEEGETARELRDAGFAVQRFPSLLGLALALAKRKPDILHTHMYRANIVGRILGRICGVPTIISSQRSLDAWKKPHHVWLDSLTAGWTHKIVANSQATKELLIRREGIAAGKIEVIYNGIDPDPPKVSHNRQEIRSSFGFDPRDVVVGFIGRYHQEKGTALLPEIVRIATTHDPRIKFLFIGDGHEKQTLSKIVKPGDSRVVMTGYRSDTDAMLAAMDIFLLPSLEESFSQSALEALSAGVPVVASQVGGLKELVSPEVGFLLPPQDAGSFALALERLAKNDSLRRQMGLAAKQKAGEFTLKKMHQSMETLYKSVLPAS